MLNPIDFLHDKKTQESYLLNPAKVQEQILDIFKNNEGKEWPNNEQRRFALLNRLIWTMSILDTIDNYLDYSENDIVTFFVAFYTFYSITEAFNSKKIVKNCFSKTLAEEIFKNEDRQEWKLASLIRVLSFAHMSNACGTEGFLEGSKIILVSMDSQSISPSDDEIKTKPRAFYFHVLVSKNGVSEPQIFKVFIDEIKNFLKERYDNCNFKKLKEKNEQV